MHSKFYFYPTDLIHEAKRRNFSIVFVVIPIKAFKNKIRQGKQAKAHFVGKNYFLFLPGQFCFRVTAAAIVTRARVAVAAEEKVRYESSRRSERVSKHPHHGISWVYWGVLEMVR